MDDRLNDWNELKIHTRELVAAAQALTEYGTDSLDPRFEPSITSASKIQLARRRVTAVLGRLQSLVTEPGDFIERLAHHVSLACLLISQQHDLNQS